MANVFFWQVLSSQLSMDAMSFVTEDRKTAQESTFPNTHTFDLFGGVDVSLASNFLLHWRFNTKPIVSFCCVPLTQLSTESLFTHFYMQFFDYYYSYYCLLPAPLLFNGSELCCLPTAARGNIDEADNNYAEEENPK